MTSKPIRLSTNFMTFIPSLTFTDYDWSMEHLQRVWHASRERLPFRTPGSVPHCGTCLCYNYWPDSLKLPCLYSTFHLEYPLVLSRFCLVMVSCRIQQYVSYKVTGEFSSFQIKTGCRSPNAMGSLGVLSLPQHGHRNLRRRL